MGDIGRRKGARGSWPSLWILKFPAKKGCFLSFEWEKSKKSIFTTFGPPYKNLGKTLVAPPFQKILPTPMFQKLFSGFVVFH